MQLRILSESDVRSAITMRQAIEAMREAFGQLAAGEATVPLRTSLETEKGVTLFMPAYLKGSGDLGAKIVSVYAGNPALGLPTINAVVIALDGGTGQPLALMDGTYLTALRTGAASGLATELLARPNASIVAVFGAGAQARTQLEAVRTVRPIREVRIVSRTRSSAERFAAEIEGVAVRVMDDRSAAVQGAHIVIAATTSSTPVFDGRDVAPGTHVNGIGSYTPEMQEVDATLVQRAKVVVDSREAALAEAGDLIIPLRQGLITADHIHAELGEIVNGDKAGRTSDDEITFFKSVGNAAQDVVTARWVLQAAEEKGLGTVVTL
jgi:ornithine cyclodeaminase